MNETRCPMVGRASSRAGSGNRSSRCESALTLPVRAWSGLCGLDGLLPRLFASSLSSLSMPFIMHRPRPLRQPPLPQKIFIIQPQLLQARPRHVRELEFGFLGRAAGLAALGNVLHAAPRRLRHLVVRAAAPVNVTVAEPHRHVRRLKILVLVALRRGDLKRAIHRILAKSEKLVG